MLKQPIQLQTKNFICMKSHKNMNFKILTVNGQDLSGASNEEAADAFARASEPITVMVRRTGGQEQTRTEVTSSRQTNNDAPSPSPHCFCRHLIESCENSTSVFASLILSELERVRDRSLRKRAARSSLSDPVANSTIGDDFDCDDVFDFNYEEIVVERGSSNNRKLGIVLCERPHPSTRRPQVFISEIVTGSVADRRLLEQDRIVAINGKPVSDINSARSLLTGSDPTVTFVVARRLQTQTNFYQPEELTATDDVFDDVTNRQYEMSHGHHQSEIHLSIVGNLSRTTPRDTHDARKTTQNHIRAQSTNTSIDQSSTDSGCSLSHLQSTIAKLELSQDATCNDVNTPIQVSPWVRIAQQDYENMMRDIEERELATDRTPPHPRVDIEHRLSSSSAYSTGRSSDMSPSTSAPPTSRPILPLSSDANSDVEGPGCILTTGEEFSGDDEDLDGFEDAAIEFQTSICPQAPPVPLPRVRNPPPTRPTDASVVSITDSFKRQSTAASEAVTSQITSRSLPQSHRLCESQETGDKLVQFATDQTDVERRPTTDGRRTNEWKVRVRRDGTRYITKRSSRDQRAERVARVATSDDDDATTEVKLGRHWTRDERRRHLRRAREKKLRREHMRQCGLQMFNASEAGGKMEVRPARRQMLLDNFVTVQELLAHGNHRSMTNDDAATNDGHPLLSVSYI